MKTDQILMSQRRSEIVSVDADLDDGEVLATVHAWWDHVMPETEPTLKQNMKETTCKQSKVANTTYTRFELSTKKS